MPRRSSIEYLMSVEPAFREYRFSRRFWRSFHLIKIRLPRDVILSKRRGARSTQREDRCDKWKWDRFAEHRSREREANRVAFGSSVYIIGILLLTHHNDSTSSYTHLVQQYFTCIYHTRCTHTKSHCVVVILARLRAPQSRHRAGAGALI